MRSYITAELVRIIFDFIIADYKALQVGFWLIHIRIDVRPTTLVVVSNGQGTAVLYFAANAVVFFGKLPRAL
ncbi:hypothetical protein BD408DRAFT_250876 [Parasitella parasitica]|nr:hypothetical protein BD408DRAFT_250876 [Parasitella parasitica]